MFWYNYQPSNNNRRRRRGMSYGFPWLFIGFFWIAPHLWWAFFGLALVIFLVMAIRNADPNRFKWSSQQPPNQFNQYYTPPQQQPYQQPNAYYTPPQPPYYEPYEGGYQAEARPAQEQKSAEAYYSPAREQQQEEAYQDYDQPKAEYPQQLPPM